jgi:hypothetical protein
MGFPLVVGRRSCPSGDRLIVEHLKRAKPASVVIAAGGGEPGRTSDSGKLPEAQIDSRAGRR